jgi:hypothetical protein
MTCLGERVPAETKAAKIVEIALSGSHKLPSGRFCPWVGIFVVGPCRHKAKSYPPLLAKIQSNPDTDPLIVHIPEVSVHVYLQ